jgi:hypothetical protein
MFTWCLFNLTKLRPSEKPLWLTQFPYYLGDEDYEDTMRLTIAVDEYLAVFENMRNEWQNWVTARQQQGNPSPPPHDFGSEILGQKFANPKKLTPTEKVYLLKVLYADLRKNRLPQHIFQWDTLAEKTLQVQYVNFETAGSDDHDLNNEFIRYQFYEPLRFMNNQPRLIAAENSTDDKHSPHHTIPQHNRTGSSPVWLSVAEVDNWEMVPTHGDLVHGHHRILDNEVYIVVPEGSKLADSGSANMGVIPKSNALHPFLSALASGQFRLKQKPLPGTPAAFAEDDEWQQFLRLALSAPNATLTLTTGSWPPDKHDFGEYVIEVNFKTDSTQRAVTLSTKNAATALGVSASGIEKMVSMAVTLPFIITPSAGTTSWTLGEVSSFVDFRYSNAVQFARDVPLELVTDTTARNAMWFVAGGPHFTDMRLEFEVPKDKYDRFEKWLDSKGKNFSIQKISVIARRRQSYSYGVRTDRVLSEGEIAFSIDLFLCGASFTAYTVFSENTVRLRLQMNPSPTGGSLKDLVDWALTTLKIGNFECGTWLGQATGSILDAIKPRVIDLTLGYKEDKLQGIESLHFTLQVELKRGKTDNGNPKESVVFFLTYGWSQKRKSWFKGSLWASK